MRASKSQDEGLGVPVSNRETCWQGKIQQYYDIDKKKIGEGSYGSVCKARNKADSVES